MKTFPAAILVAMLAFPCAATATEGYVGAGIGQSYVDTGFFGETDTGYKIFGGARFNPYVAAELAYYDLGKPEENFFGIVRSVEVKAFSGWLKGIWPATKWLDLYGKLGLAYWKTDETDSPFGQPAQTTSSDGFGLAYGLGATFNIGQRLALLLEFEDVNGGIDGAALLSASVAVRF